ncbi:hypothetical protein GE21DRAFT_1206651 [Neurospora crassa]|nr:hypothetical protein B15I20.170 [imported] - Neurospora crassa [Neurospora crassa]KHE85296.1 hypothetical protein GE21DRAFT_1206651 [Neurospora crassa]
MLHAYFREPDFKDDELTWLITGYIFSARTSATPNGRIEAYTGPQKPGVSGHIDRAISVTGRDGRSTMHEYNPLDHLLEATRALAGLADGADFVVKSQLVPTFGAICGMANDKQTFADNSWNAVQALIQDLKPDCQRDLLYDAPRDL